MSATDADVRLPLEWDSEEKHWTCPLIDRPFASLVDLVARSDSGFYKVDSRKYLVETNRPGSKRISWMDAEENRPEQVFAQILVKPKPPGTVFGIPIPILAPVVAAFATATAAFVFQFINIQQGALSPKEAAQLQLDLDNARKKVVVTQKDLAEANTQIAELSVVKKEQEDLHKLFLSGPDNVKSTYVLGLSHGYRLEVIKRFTDGQPQLRSMLMGIEEDYIRSSFSSLSDGAFTQGKAVGQRQSNDIYTLGEPSILEGQDVLSSLQGE